MSFPLSSRSQLSLRKNITQQMIEQTRKTSRYFFLIIPQKMTPSSEIPWDPHQQKTRNILIEKLKI